MDFSVVILELETRPNRAYPHLYGKLRDFAMNFLWTQCEHAHMSPFTTLSFLILFFFHLDDPWLRTCVNQKNHIGLPIDFYTNLTFASLSGRSVGRLTELAVTSCRASAWLLAPFSRRSKLVSGVSKNVPLSHKNEPLEQKRISYLDTADSPVLPSDRC